MVKWIYFLRAKQLGRLKIGVSADPLRRVKQCQTSSPEILELVGLIKETKDITEYSVHNLFHEYRVKGEWFKDNPIILEYLEANRFPEEDIPVAIFESRIVDYLTRYHNSTFKKLYRKFSVNPDLYKQFCQAINNLRDRGFLYKDGYNGKNIVLNRK